MELYSKEELLKELKKEYSCGGECDHCPEVLDAGSCSVLRCIRRIIDNVTPVDISGNEYFPYRTAFFNGVEAAKHGEWIPVSERLPKYSGLYLISVDDLVTVANFTGTYFMNRGGYVEVDAWQPLLKPYKSYKKGGAEDEL